MEHARLGERLLASGRINDADLARALQAQAQAGGLLGQILVRLGALAEPELLDALAQQLGLPLQGRDDAPAPERVQAFMAETRTSASWWRDKGAVAWRRDDGGVVCAAYHPLDAMLNEVLETAAPAGLEVRLAPRDFASALLETVSGRPDGGADASDAARLRELADEAPVVDFVNGVFAEALQRGASDVHFEPLEDRFVVRLRVDGILHAVRTAPRATFEAVGSRIKLLSAMDIGERRLPQDGRQAIRVSGQEVDLRVSTLPTTWGESVVARLLGKSTRLPQLAELGLEPADEARLRAGIARPNGVLLITGPTGSGKTTTIYRLLSELNDGRRKIVTVEDPVEFELPGVMQVRVRAEIGLSFSAALRSILRQDPDVIMVGEIRDPETARIAVQAALTGHLVISTLHTNSALASVGRMLDLGTEAYLLADVLRGLAAQRLVRKLCPHCAQPASEPQARAYEAALAPAVQRVAAAESPRWLEPQGCPRCGGTGFLGRIGVYETAPVTAELASLVRREAPADTLAGAAMAGGFTPLLQAGLLKARRGETSVGEVHRVIGAADEVAAAAEEAVA